VRRFAKYETSAQITPRPVNPFDPAQIDVRGIFVDARGRRFVAIGFWYQRYERALVGGYEHLTPVGDPGWRVRFSAPHNGTWKWWWEVSTPAGDARSARHTLSVVGGSDPGFVRRSSLDARYLVHDNGSPFFAIGENVGWYDGRGTYAYDDWYSNLAERGANFARVWMPSWAFGIEWSDTGLGDYTGRLDRAWQLDHVLDAGARRGIYQMLSLQNHGAFSTIYNSEWSDNPYNVANGGPLASPEEFFTNHAAKRSFKRRLRYVVARWGYSTHLLAWELWNEVDLTDAYDSAAVTAWHREMARYLRSLDPNRHLVTTSHALFFDDPAVWRAGGLDFTQLHFYSRSDGLEILPNIADDVTRWTADRIETTGRPVLFAELGTDSRGPAETVAADPRGIGIHDGLWAGVVSGGFGTAMTWWWDNVIAAQPNRYYRMFGSVARFVNGVRWDREQFHAPRASARSSARPLVLYGLQGVHRLLLWLKDDAYQWNSSTPVTVADARLRIRNLRAGEWCGSWFSTWSGHKGREVHVDTSRLPETISVPDFTGDIALRLHRCAG